MSVNSQSGSSFPGRIATFLVVAALIAGVCLNGVTYLQLTDLLNRKASLNSILEKEKPVTKQLAELDARFKKYESESVLMEHGLKELYSKRCTKLEEFIPVFDDSIVTCRAGRGIRGYKGMIHVPKRGNHRLRIEAVKTTLAIQTAHRNEKEEIAWSESFPLESDRNDSVRITRLGGQKVQIKLSGEEIKTIDFPLGNSGAYGTFDLSFERTVMSPNQYAADPYSDQSKFWFGAVKNYSGGGVFMIRLAIESDGPTTSLPDDLMVVRKLLKDYESGIEPQFTFNPKGWYEFKE